MRRGGPFRIPAQWVGLLVSGLADALLAAPQAVMTEDPEGQAGPYMRTARMIPMRDGVKLHTTLYTPGRPKAMLPFILMRTPYDADAGGPKAHKGYLKNLADEGYLFVFQDIRGRHKS